MKRRWIVVMVGLRGLATGHRSELGSHRNQERARIAALEALAVELAIFERLAA